MKKIITCFALFASVLMVSCSKKSDVKPAGAPVAATTLNIEYRISSVSGQVGVDYIAPNASGELEVLHTNVTRQTQSINFSFLSGNNFSVKAYNLNPSHSVVQVQIFVNGVMEAEASTTNPYQPAIAQGNF